MIPVIILAGGLGSRLGKLTKNKPKALIKINNKTFLEWQIEYLIKQKIKNIIICLGYKHHLILNLLKKRNFKKIDIQISHDGNKLLGTGGAIKKALKKINSSFFVVYGDSFVRCNLNNIYKNFVTNKNFPLMGIYKNSNKFDKSNVKLKKNNKIIYDKKIKGKNFNYIDYGISIMNSEDFINYKKKVFDLATIQNELSKKNKLRGYIIKKRFFEIGSVNGIREFKKFVNNEFHKKIS